MTKPKPKRTPHERSAELRALLGCTSATERTIDAARRLLRENERLKAQVRTLQDALAVAWESAAE
jgi:hypothetical protein